MLGLIGDEADQKDSMSELSRLVDEFKAKSTATLLRLRSSQESVLSHFTEAEKTLGNDLETVSKAIAQGYQLVKAEKDVNDEGIFSHSFFFSHLPLFE